MLLCDWSTGVAHEDVADLLVQVSRLLAKGTTMPYVRTVTGDVDPSTIGITSMHEHIFIDARVWFEEAQVHSTSGWIDPDTPVDASVLWALAQNPMILRDNLVLDDEDLAVDELTYYEQGGGSCIVDVTSIGLAPNPAGLKRVAERTGLHIVAGCGFYVEQSHPASVVTASAEDLGRMIVSALTQGIEETDIRAGIIGEIGTSLLSPGEEKVLHAAAQAQLTTGAAISIHTQRGFREGERIIRMLVEDGVQPERIILGHMDDALIDTSVSAPNLAHLDYHRRCLQMGVYVQYDTFGMEWTFLDSGIRKPRDTDRAAALATLIAEGYGDQLLVGLDVWVKQCLRRYGGWGYDHLVRVVPRLLRAAGLTDVDIDRLLIHNPRRALTFAQNS
jgi:phosphotriesterase-related protein